MTAGRDEVDGVPVTPLLPIPKLPRAHRRSDKPNAKHVGSALMDRLESYNQKRANAAQSLRDELAAILDEHERHTVLTAKEVSRHLNPAKYWERGWPAPRTIQEHLKKIRAQRHRPRADSVDRVETIESTDEVESNAA